METIMGLTLIMGVGMLAGFADFGLGHEGDDGSEPDDFPLQDDDGFEEATDGEALLSLLEEANSGA